MIRWLKHLLCNHWYQFHTYSFDESVGPIICCEQKTDTVTIETRTCHKCGYQEQREINREHLGWN